MTSDDGDDDTAVGIPVVVPALGDGVDEATLSSWIVRTGDHVDCDQPIASLALDKIDVELAAPAAGVVIVERQRADVLQAGDVVARIVPAPPGDAADEARHAELYAAIVRDPGDAGARQVYADFLLSVGKPLGRWGAETVAARGEYLSIVEQLKRPLSGDERAALVARRDELGVIAHDTARSLVPVAGNLRVRAGFVAAFRADATRLAEVHERLFANAPIRGLGVLRLTNDDVDRVLALPRLEQLRELLLVASRIDAVELTRLVASPRLRGVVDLDLRRCPELHDAALGDRRFERLAISDTHEWSVDALRAVVARTRGELVLSGAGAMPVLDASALDELELRGYALERDSLATAVALRRLTIAQCGFADPAALHELVARLPPGLEALALYEVTAGGVDATQLVDELRAATSATLEL